MVDTLRWCSTAGIEAHAVEMRREVGLHDLAALTALAGVIESVRPDVLHLHSSKAGGVGRLAALTRPSLAVVYTPNGSAAYLGRVYLWLERFLGHLRTDALIAVSQSEYEEFREAGYAPASRIVRIDSGIDADQVVRFSGSLERDDSSRPLVVTVGRLSQQKDPLFLAEVSAKVLASLPEAAFVWVGDGEMRAAFESRLLDLGISDSWTITGWQRNPFNHLAQADVFVLGSRYESFGYVTLEAMALSKPVVATRVAGSADLIETGLTGYLVERGDVAGFADRICSLIQDPDNARRLGERGHLRAAHFSSERMASETIVLYRRVASERNANRFPLGMS